MSIRYVDLAQELRSRIASGVYPSGGCIESEAELARDCAVSRTTVRTALELLRDDGLITSRKGSGWFVTGEAHHQQPGPLVLADDVPGAPRSSKRRVLQFSYERSTAPVRRALGLKPAETVLTVTVLTSASELPLALQMVHIPDPLGSTFSRANFEGASPTQLIDTHRTLKRASQNITASLATEAHKALRVAPGAALLISRGMFYDTQDQPVFAYEDCYRADRIAFDVDYQHSRPIRAR